MRMNLRVVTYSSFASPGLQPADFEEILTLSRANNARDAVTGLLMFNGAAFTQSIEGPTAAIDRLVMRIANDARQCQMEICDDRAIDRRIFPDWTMGYVRLEGGWLEGQYGIADALSRDMPPPIREVLMSMASTLPFQ